MDDRNFDELSACDWISAVEGADAKIREADTYPRLRSWIGERSPVKILDIGCGQGVCADKIALAGRSYAGVDPSEVLIERARRLYGSYNRNFVIGNAYSLPFAEASFDAALAVNVWHLLSDPAKAAAELGRVLRPGGGFLIVTANPDAYSLWTERYASSVIDGRRFEGRGRRADGSQFGDVLYLHTLAEIGGSLAAAGLNVTETERFRASQLDPDRQQYLLLKGERGP